ncbi:MAG: ATP synthase subunit I [Chloroflexi bacterium]|nr:ATP synthase subunit I [Chloroflexota bacterium]
MTKDDQLLAEMARRNWIILAVLVLLSLFWQSASISLGVLAGGLLVIFNYRWLGRSLLKLISDPQLHSAKGFTRNYYFRLIVVASAIYLLLVRGGVHPLALVIGLSVVVLNLLVATLKRLY